MVTEEADERDEREQEIVVDPATRGKEEKEKEVEEEEGDGEAEEEDNWEDGNGNDDWEDGEENEHEDEDNDEEEEEEDEEEEEEDGAEDDDNLLENALAMEMAMGDHGESLYDEHGKQLVLGPVQITAEDLLGKKPGLKGGHEAKEEEQKQKKGKAKAILNRQDFLTVRTVHLICLTIRCQLVNQWCRSPLLSAKIVSLLPDSLKSNTSTSLFKVKIRKIIAWFRMYFKQVSRPSIILQFLFYSDFSNVNISKHDNNNNNDKLQNVVDSISFSILYQ